MHQHLKKIHTHIPRITFVLLCFALINVAALCTRSDESEPEGPLGVYVTEDSGDTYSQKNSVIPDRSLGYTSIHKIAIDKFNKRIMYLGTRDKGILKSEDRGQTWQRTNQQDGTFYGIDVDPKDNRTVYAAGFVGDRGVIYKSEDGGINWEETYRETDPGKKVFDVQIDHFNTENVYASTELGAIIKSEDKGKNWSVSTFLPDRAIFLRMSPYDSRHLFASGPEIGLHRTTDGGENWKKIEFPERFSSANTVYDFRYHPTEQNVVYVGSEYGFLRSDDLGETWVDIPLLVRPEPNSLIRFVIDPQNPQNIYLTLNTSMYRSRDAGKSWEVDEKITPAIIYSLEIHPDTPDTIYVGVWDRDNVVEEPEN